MRKHSGSLRHNRLWGKDGKISVPTAGGGPETARRMGGEAPSERGAVHDAVSRLRVRVPVQTVGETGALFFAPPFE